MLGKRGLLALLDKEEEEEREDGDKSILRDENH